MGADSWMREWDVLITIVQIIINKQATTQQPSPCVTIIYLKQIVTFTPPLISSLTDGGQSMLCAARTFDLIISFFKWL